MNFDQRYVHKSVILSASNWVHCLLLCVCGNNLYPFLDIKQEDEEAVVNISGIQMSTLFPDKKSAQPFLLMYTGEQPHVHEPSGYKNKVRTPGFVKKLYTY